MEESTLTHVPEAILTEILARLHLRSISRFKSVCKTWKSTLESVFFRRVFVSLHKNSSSSWSLIRGGFMGEELIGFHGCETWDLPKSPASYIPPRSKPLPDLETRNFAYSASSNGLVLMEGSGYGCYVGNPVLQQWVEIPSCPYESHAFGLVTRVDEDGVVLSFKVVRLEHRSSTCLSVCMYSSETGIWTSKRVYCPCHIAYSSHMSLKGTLYFLSQTDFLIAEPGVLMAHDFYSESDQCRVIPLPDHSYHDKRDFKRALTTCGGFVVYIKTLPQKVDDILKVWRLTNVGLGDECWQLLWETRLPFIRSDIGYYAPMAMHPFDSNTVYIWSEHNRHLVSCNLRTQTYRILKDASNRNTDDCFLNQSTCQKYMDQIWGSRSLWIFGAAVALFQFVLPRWIESIPRPPQVDMIDTTSLLSYISSVHKTMRDKGNQ